MSMIYGPPQELNVLSELSKQSGCAIDTEVWLQVYLTWFKLGRQPFGLDLVAYMGHCILREEWIHTILEMFALPQGWWYFATSVFSLWVLGLWKMRCWPLLKHLCLLWKPSSCHKQVHCFCFHAHVCSPLLCPHPPKRPQQGEGSITQAAHIACVLDIKH